MIQKLILPALSLAGLAFAFHTVAQGERPTPVAPPAAEPAETPFRGTIAGAGIVVRNSIILVDFIEQRLREGMPLAEAVVDAGAVRFRPMLLTAMAVVVGASVILADPIFQGLAISLMAGEVASLLISRMAVPVLYFMANRRLQPITPAS